MIIRMGMRLLCEVAFKKGWEKDLKTAFDSAKSTMSQDEKNTLHTHSVSKQSIVSLLQSGAHGYSASKNLEQTVAISLIIGKVLRSCHGKPCDLIDSIFVVPEKL